MSASWGGLSGLGLGYSLSSQPSLSTCTALPSCHGHCIDAVSVALVILVVLVDFIDCVRRGWDRREVSMKLNSKGGREGANNNKDCHHYQQQFVIKVRAVRGGGVMEHH